MKLIKESALLSEKGLKTLKENKASNRKNLCASRKNKRNLKESMGVNVADLAKSIENDVKYFAKGGEGCSYYKLGTTVNGTMLYYVMGFQNDDIDEQDKNNYIMSSDGNALLLGKIAVNCDDLQSDFDIDWNMPYSNVDGEVYWTQDEFHKNGDDYLRMAKGIANQFKKLQRLEIDDDGAVNDAGLNESNRSNKKQISSKRKLNEEVSDEAYEVAEKINYSLKGVNDFVSYDDFNHEFYSAMQDVFGKDFSKSEFSDSLPNGSSLGDFEADVRGILGNMGWETILEGEDEGGIRDVNAEMPLANEIIYQALKEYENNHYETEGHNWQLVINKLLDYYESHKTDTHDIEEYKESLNKSSSKKSLKENDSNLNNKSTKVKNAIELLESISPDILYLALAIYEWSSESGEVIVDNGKLNKLNNFLDGVDSIYDEYVREKSRKILNGKDFDESLKEMANYNLNTQYDKRASFYNKATVDVDDNNGVKTLYSYNTPVAKIDGKKVELLPKWNFSQTTLRHVKEFLRQNGFTADSIGQMKRDYCNK